VPLQFAKIEFLLPPGRIQADQFLSRGLPDELAEGPLAETRKGA
jgi:hypothetical protein